MPSTTHEHTLNVTLARQLRARGLNANPEITHARGKRIDIEVHIGIVRVAVEAEHGQTPTKQREALKDADARITQNLARCAVAVCYPDNTTENTIPTAQYLYQVRDHASRGRKGAWQRGNIDNLASVIRLAPAQIGDPDAAAAALSAQLDEAVRRLAPNQKQRLASALDLPPSKTAPRADHTARWDRAAKRALLLVATAVMFHSRLDAHLPDSRPEINNRITGAKTPFTGAWPPMPANHCLLNQNAPEDAPVIQQFTDAWNLILALDYKPIFETALAAIQACPPDPAFADAIRETAKAALAVAQNIASLRHDLLGRIFHTVLDTARYDGSFYTTTAAATLLASLAITQDLCDWQNPNAIANLRITDPACGTGTLLMAAAQRIHDLAPQTRNDGNAAQALIEQVLSGYDVNLTATHMAATTLGLLSPTTRFRNMKIGRAFLGVDNDGRARLGSLEFLDQKPLLMDWPNAAQPVTQIDGDDPMNNPDRADIIIMNPPFTRDSLRHDQFTPDNERKMKAREKSLFSKTPVHLSSNGNAFIILADFMRKSRDGKIAAILPLVTATNASALEIRQFIGKYYHVECIVTSHDPRRIYFSENTNIGEMLLICRAWDSVRDAKPPTKVVNLAVNPATPADAYATADAIRNDAVASRELGTIQEVSPQEIENGDWKSVLFLSPALRGDFVSLERNEIAQVLPLGNIAAIGPAGRRTYDAFTFSGMPTASGMVALKQHDTKITQSMQAQPDSFIEPNSKKAKLAESYWSQRSHFLLPHRLFLPTARVVAVRIDTPGLGGSGWTPCNLILPENSRLTQSEWESALCAYLNSSVGVLAILGERSNKKPTYPNFSLDDLRRVLVPDFPTLGDNAIRHLAAAYDAQCQTPLLPLPQMPADPVRRALDNAVGHALAIPPERLARIRRNLAAEPSITAKPYAPLTP